MRIGIDAQFLTHPQPGGFKTYTENLVTSLAEIDAENEYFLYLDRTPNEDLKIPQKPNFTCRIVAGDYPGIGMPWREQIALPLQVARDRLDLFHSPCQTGPLFLTCPSVVTIHDVIWFFSRKFTTGRPRPLRRNLIGWYIRSISPHVAHRASAIITVSKASKNDIARFLGIPEQKIFVTLEAASSIYCQIDDLQQLNLIRKKFDLSPEFILAIGSADPRKNISMLIEAYALLPHDLRSQHQLVIVWTHNYLEEEINQQITKLGITDLVKFIPRASDDDLILLYNAAALFVFPSLYEGFGLPPLEAIACGTPVLAANNSSLPEILGDAALFVDLKNDAELALKMTELLTNEQVRSDLIRKGFNRVKEFSWKKCASETLELFRQIPSL